MKPTSLPFKLLLLATAVAVGYLLTAAARAVFGSGEPPPAQHVSRLPIVPSPEELMARSSAGADIPMDIQSRMLGQTAPPAPKRRVRQEPRLEEPYAFAVGEHLKEQVEAMKADLRNNPDLQHQEDGVTLESLDAMAREGRMAW